MLINKDQKNKAPKRNETRKEGTKQGRKIGRKKERKEGRKVESKEGRKRNLPQFEELIDIDSKCSRNLSP